MMTTIIKTISSYQTWQWEIVFLFLIAAVELVLSIIWIWKSQWNSFCEFQEFLLKTNVLGDDYRRPTSATPWKIKKMKQKLTEIGIQDFQKKMDKFQANAKHLQEIQHTLDRFVGTHASKFAAKLSNKPEWEAELVKFFVLFSDVRGFTSLTEKLSPAETVRFLNRMYAIIDGVISMYGGEINKFIGDAVMAFFPYFENSGPSVPKKVLSAALKMQDQFHEMHGKFRDNYSQTIEAGLGVGMALGPSVIGNIGSLQRMEFTLIGDTVNLASRLCSVAEDGQILVNEEIAALVQDQFRLEKLPPVRLKGKSGAYTPYVVLGENIRPGLV
jgi:class 3 adenylate cyclase